MRKKPNDENTFWQRVSGAGGSSFEHCWIWRGGIDRHGYGKFVVQWKWHQAHKFAYQAMVHEVPAGLELDHLCRTPACVNPWHLEPVTHRVNCARRAAFVIRERGADCCINGHLRSDANVYVSPGGTRTCRPCNAASQARRRARRKAAA